MVQLMVQWGPHFQRTLQTSSDTFFLERPRQLNSVDSDRLFCGSPKLLMLMGWLLGITFLRLWLASWISMVIVLIHSHLVSGDFHEKSWKHIVGG